MLVRRSSRPMPPQPGRTVLCSVSPSGSARRARRAIWSLGHCGRLGLLGRRRPAERRVCAERSCPGNKRSTVANHELGTSSPDRFTSTIRAPGDHPPPGLMSGAEGAVDHTGEATRQLLVTSWQKPRHRRDESPAPCARRGRDLLGRREEPVYGCGLGRVRPRREADPAESLRQDQARGPSQARGAAPGTATWARVISGRLSASSPPATPPGLSKLVGISQYRSSGGSVLLCWRRRLTARRSGSSHASARPAARPGQPDHPGRTTPAPGHPRRP
jgi:hypothetical protein